MVGGVGDHVDPPVWYPPGDDRDHLCGEVHRGGGALALPAPAQHRQAHRPRQERQPHDNPDDDPPVPEGQLVAAGCGAVVDPPDAVDFPAPAAMRGVIDRQVHLGVIVEQVGQDQIEGDQADLVNTPAGGREEPVRPVMRPRAGQPGAGKHPTDCALSGLRDQPDDHGLENAERRRGETPGEGVQQPTPRDG